MARQKGQGRTLVQKLCSPFSRNARENADLERRINSDDIYWKQWTENPIIKLFPKAQQTDMYDALQIRAARGQENIPDTEFLTVEQYKVQGVLQKEFLKKIEKQPNAVEQMFYIKSELFKTSPIHDTEFKKILDGNDMFNAKILNDNKNLGKIIDFLKISSEYEGTISQATKEFLVGSKSPPEKLLNKMNKRLIRIAKKQEKFNGATGDNAAREFYLKGNVDGKMTDPVVDVDGKMVHKESLDYLTKKGELKVFRDFSKIVTATKSERTKMFNDQTIHTATKEAAKTWINDVAHPTNLEVLKGLEKFKKLITKTKAQAIKNHPNYERLISNIENIEKNIIAQEKGDSSSLLPVLTLDVFPTIEGNLQKIFTSKSDREMNVAFDGIASIDNMLKNNMYTAKKIKDDANRDVMMDYNIFPLIDSYSRNSAKFLHSMKMTESYLKVVNETEKMARKFGNNPEYKNFSNAMDVQNAMMAKLFQRNTGYSDNPIADKLTRISTGLQFFSKMGWNFKSIGKNATQRYFNHIYYGISGVRSLRKILEDDESIRIRADIGLRKSGLTRADIKETYSDVNLPVQQAADGTYSIAYTENYLDSIDEFVGRAVERSGRGLQKVENDINRKYTYELSFAKEWKNQDRNLLMHQRKFEYSLKKNKQEIEQMKNNTDSEIAIDPVTKIKSNEYDVKFKEYRQKNAEIFAKNITKFLHYDYSTAQKSFAQTSKVGSLALQFKHYLLSNAVMQKKMIEEGLGDIRSGQVNTKAVGRAVRMSSYTMIIEAITDIGNYEFGNFFENAAFNEIKKFYDLMTVEDDEERDRIFYNKGVFAGNMGPTFGMILEIGEMLGVFDMFAKEGTFVSYMLGRETAAKEDDDMTIAERATRILNVQGHRTAFKTFPRVTEALANERNPFAPIFTTETGIYPSRRKLSERPITGAILKTLGLYPDSAIEKKTANINTDEAILQSLDYMNKTN